MIGGIAVPEEKFDMFENIILEGEENGEAQKTENEEDLENTETAEETEE